MTVPALMRRLIGALLSLLFIAAGLAVAGYAAATCRVVLPFRNPVAYAGSGGSFYVVEKERNTLLELTDIRPGQPARLVRATRIEPDDETYYYVILRLRRGPAGLVVESRVYDRARQAFLGYRYREYAAPEAPPRDLLTVLFSNPTAYPEFSYDADPSGNPCFANNCDGQRTVWRIPPAGGVTVVNEQLPPSVQTLGGTNSATDSWASLGIGPDGSYYLCSRARGQVLEFAPEGRPVRAIGTVGFGQTDLMAPEYAFFTALPGDADRLLTVASTGNRAWVQYNSAGRVVRAVAPLEIGYPFRDVLVGMLFEDPAAAGTLCSFDLPNKAILLLGADRADAVTEYVACRPWRTAALGAGAALIVLLGATRRAWWAWLARRPFPAFLKLLILFIPLLVASALTVGEYVQAEMRGDLEAEYVRRSENLAWAVIHSLSMDDLQAIRKPADREGPAYERIHSAISRIVDAEHVASTPKWILHKIRDGHFYFGINVWRGAIFEPFFVPQDRPMFHRVLREKTPQWGRYMDDEGEWFSLLFPITDADGNVIYVLELYRSTEELDRAGRRARDRARAIAGLTALAGALLAALFGFLFTRPLRELARGAALVSTGDFDHRIPVRTRDEAGRLAAAFNKMVVDLKQYTADLARTTAEKERIASELRFAREVQQGALPKAFPPFPGAEDLEIAARIEPAREIGGDYYDFFAVDDDRFGVAIGDVSGKGMAAGLFLMAVRTALRDGAPRVPSAAEVVRKVNLALAADNPSCMFVTLFYLVCDLRTGRVTYCSAGHLPPFVIRGDEISQLPIQGSPAAGATEDARYADGTFTLGDGDTLVLYTDGVTEATDVKDAFYGDERLLRRLRAGAGKPGRELLNGVFDDVLAYQQGTELSDDITMLVMTWRRS